VRKPKLLEIFPNGKPARSVPLLQIVSGCTHRRFASDINHRAYADRHALPYTFDDRERTGLRSPFYHKGAAMIEALPNAEWTFWLDDDAFFMRHDDSLADLLLHPLVTPQTQLVFCRSPINRGMWTYISAGNILVKNSPLMRDFFARSMEIDLEVVRNWWDAEKYGLYCHSDQDAMVYLIATEPDIARATVILDYSAFNCRDFHFAHPHDWFLVHFAGVPDKRVAIEAFASKHGLNDALLPST
jgi:hypothetical protein